MTRSGPPLPSLADAEWLRDPLLQQVLAALSAEGGEARLAGGAVRNALLGEPVSDIDIATTEVPERVMELSRRAGLDVYPTGLDHGTVTVVAKQHDRVTSFEVTTLRVDVETYGRRAQVAFTDDWAADARRRDFTMNALYCDAAGRILDPVGGYPDVVARRVRFVGEPQARIGEDYLRILRFFRFHARYGDGAPDRRGLAACIALQEGLKRLSAERIRQEIFRLLAAPRAVRVMRIMARTGIARQVVPRKLHIARLAHMAAIDAAHGLEPDPVLRVAAGWLGGVADAVVLRQALKLSNAEHARLQHLADSVLPSPSLRHNERRIVLYQVGAQGYRDAVRFAWSMDTGAGPNDWAELLALPEHWPVPRFPVGGADLAERGLAPGPEMGRVLKALEDWWMAAGFPSDKHAVLRHADELLAKPLD